MKVIITGATGFLGAHLVQYFLDNGHEVIAVCRKNSNNLDALKDKNVEIVYADMNEYNTLHTQIREADVFIHLAWNGIRALARNDRIIQQKNIENSHNAVVVAKKLNCKLFVFAGSQDEFGKQKHPFTADTFGHPDTEYGKAKLEFAMWAYDYCVHHEMKFLHLRIVSLYGERDYRGTLIMECLHKMLNQEEIHLKSSCTQMWNYLYVKDAANQIFKLCIHVLENENILSESYLIASDDTRKLKDFVEEIKKITNSESIVIYGEQESEVSLQPIIAKTQRDTNGFIAEYSFESGIKNIIKDLSKQ